MELDLFWKKKYVGAANVDLSFPTFKLFQNIWDAK